ncbi:MAG: peptide chain release factor N(5)-glutamine methyltransferase [Ruminococcus sp.]
MMTLKELQITINNKLEKAGVDSPAFNSLCLIEHIYGYTQTDLITGSDKLVDESKLESLEKLVSRRINGEPLQYLVGQWEFYGYPLKVGKGVLIPRDDTEVVLNDCLSFLKNVDNPTVLDLCSGSGAIAIAISKESDATVTAVEKSEQALPYLIENVELNSANVKIINDDIFTCMDMFKDKSFDLIVSNPPYIKSDEIKDLQIEVRQEPVMALDGGKDGYTFYRHIIKHYKSKLKTGGMLAFEIGEGQYQYIENLLIQENFENIGGSYDLGNIQRTIYGTVIE